METSTFTIANHGVTVIGHSLIKQVKIENAERTLEIMQGGRMVLKEDDGVPRLVGAEEVFQLVNRLGYFDLTRDAVDFYLTLGQLELRIEQGGNFYLRNTATNQEAPIAIEKRFAERKPLLEVLCPVASRPVVGI